jgi:protein-S-isoprenylcysteine O-methyltransferase Ste14
LDSRTTSALGSFVFFWIAPAAVAGWIPWMITRWRMQPSVWGAAATRWLGAALIVAGAVVVIECFVRFALKGLGTPAPVLPTRRLVVSGLYRYVRNPMYVGVVTAIVGQALLFGSPALLVYAGVVWLAFTAFVMLYEEPTLVRQFGPSYETYRRNVRRWWPRSRPWADAPPRAPHGGRDG